MKVIINDVEYVPRIVVNDNAIMPARKLFAKAREATGCSLREVAEALDMSYNTVFNAECDGSISLKTALILSEYYGIDFNSIAKCLLADWRKSEGKRNERK